MPQSLSAVYIHLVFSTLDRQPFLSDPTLRNLTHSYLGGTSNNMGCQAIAIGGVEDHVHILANLARTVTVADWTKGLKLSASVWLKTQGISRFAWQQGYGAFSVSQENLTAVHKYIQGQEEHHRTFSFQEEYRALLEECGVAYDERYLWG